MPAKILVIEDNSANLDLMVYLLSAFGHLAYAARNGEEGLAMAAREDPDLIICDVHLPRLDGYDVLRHLKADGSRRSIPVIAVTALAMVGDRDKVLSAGFDGYLAKPIDPETFVHEILQYLGKASPRPSLNPRNAALPVGRRETRRSTILVADNVPANLDVARCILEPFGYTVLTASGCQAAFEAMTLQIPDLILSEISMTDGTGYDLIDRVKSDGRLATIPFMLITSSKDERHSERALALGAAGFLMRPIDSERLLAEVESCLAARVSHGHDTDR